MTSPSLEFARLEIVGKILVFLVDADARNRIPFDKIARVIVGQVSTIPKNDDFIAYGYVDNEMGYELKQLSRYQSGT